MPINQTSLVNQIQSLSPGLARYRDRQRRELPQAVEQYRQATRENWPNLQQLARARQAAALPVEALHFHRNLAGMESPASFVVVATDGSAIPPDRHGGMAFCYVLNISEIALGYGEQYLAHIEPSTRFYLDGVRVALPASDASLAGPENGETEEKVDPQTGEILSADATTASDAAFTAMAGDPESDEEGQGSALMLDARMSVEELVVALRLAKEFGATTALRDGPLTLWASSILNTKEGKALTTRYLGLVDRFTQAGVPVIGYTSNPRSDVVITALRSMLGNEEAYRGLVDAELFWQVLQLGECSPVFRHSARHPKDTALTEKIYFMYLRTEDEIARLEFSKDWLGTLELNAALSIVWQQIRLGQGYPVALMEAHECAVLRGSDREVLRVLLEDYGLTGQESQKGLSKRLRGI
ncbi:MAG TPA: DNA double-strand break repair nuclease NurA [Chloroflexia bacterium]|nr:DNA double-strand break repair nuclease NurA [Chloroflexia bacterium]